MMNNKPYQVNRASKYITTHCRCDVEYLQKSPMGGGHKRAARGNSLVNGMVRAKLKEETRKEIEVSLY